MRPALSDYQHLASGKVRELYRIDDDHLLFVASDRISAFDYILDSQIPDKGRILTAMSVFFFDYIEAPNHLAGPPDDPRIPDEVLGRALVVRQLEMMPVECVARGYLTGSGLLDYQQDRRGLRHRAAARASPRPASSTTPLFTPATKAELGEHDENISFDRCHRAGRRRARQPAARPHPADLHPGRRPRADEGNHHRRHQVRVRRRRATATWCWPTRSSPRTRRGTGLPTPTGRVSCSPASTSSSSATGSPVPNRAGTATATSRRHRCRRHRRRHPRPLYRSLRTHFGSARSRTGSDPPHDRADTAAAQACRPPSRVSTATSSSTPTSGCATSPTPR